MDEPTLNSTESAPHGRHQGRLAAIFLLVVGGLVLIIALVLSMRTKGTPSELPQVGRPISGFSLPDLNGRPVQLSDYAGRPVLINFWASWCPPCRAEMPDLEALHYEQQASGLVILAVNSGETRSTAAAFADELGLSFQILLDEDFALSEQWLINNLPTTILIGRDGTVKVIHIGLFRSEQMEQELIPHLIR